MEEGASRFVSVNELIDLSFGDDNDGEEEVAYYSFSDSVESSRVEAEEEDFLSIPETLVSTSDEVFSISSSSCTLNEKEEDHDLESTPPPPRPSFQTHFSQSYPNFFSPHKNEPLPPLSLDVLCEMDAEIAKVLAMEKERTLKDFQESIPSRPSFPSLRLSNHHQHSPPLSFFLPCRTRLSQHAIPFIPLLPRQNVWIPLRQLFTCPDDHVLRYVAYFSDCEGENEDSLLEDVYENVMTQGVNVNNERLALLYEYDDMVIERVISHYPQKTWMEVESLLKLRRKKSGVKTSGGARGGVDENEEDANETFLARLKRIVKSYSRWFPAKTVEWETAKKTREFDMMDSFRSLFCRICFLFDCGHHEGRGSIDDKNRDFEWEAQKKWYVNAMQSTTTTTPTCCGPYCYRSSLQQQQQHHHLSDRTALICSKTIIALSSLDICQVAKRLSALSVTCAQVFACQQELLKQKSETMPYQANFNKSTQFIVDQFRSKSFASSHLKTQTSSETARSIIKEIKHNEQPRASHNPCHHLGPCTINNKRCSCAQAGSFCSKHCGCGVYCFSDNSGVCLNLFSGCRCTNNNCRTKHCPCFTQSKACDPDLCHPHQESVVPCENTTYEGAHLLLAESTAFQAGWGIFARHEIKANAFVSEYLGELVSQVEAERRGRYCDKVNRSYLFNLNSEQVVDAFRKGSKIRFANHSRKPNCVVRMITVNRQRRVFVFAKRDIIAGEELFFDYHWDHQTSTTTTGTSTTKKSKSNGTKNWYKKKTVPPKRTVSTTTPAADSSRKKRKVTTTRRQS